MSQLRHHSHMRYATPAGEAHPAARAGRWRTRGFALRTEQSAPGKPVGDGIRGTLIAAPISLVLWMLIAFVIRLVV